uniref:Uncharacterized protein n=1 Tax=Globodera rostochiensis TaxID=31243 RepID=A0A914GU12_GLORO
MTDWNNYFGSLRKYLDYFRAHHSQIVSSFEGLAASSSSTQTISDGELAGLLSWTRFASVVAQKDPESRRQMYEERSWNCIETSTGTKLGGVQRDLEEQESNLKIYNCTQGFLTLLRILLAHKTRPNTHQLAPFIQFVIHSVLCQFSTRSYVDSNQMWNIVKLALDSLYEPLKTFYATTVVVQNKSTEVQILAQLLSDSPLSRSILQIIVEGADRLQENAPINPARDDATFSAIRLFYMAISHRTAMTDAVRVANSDLLIVSMESFLFSAIPHPRRSNENYLSLLFYYLSEFEHLAKHSFYVWLIIKEATAQRPSMQLRIVQALLPRRAQLISSMANLSSIFAPENISVCITDLLPQSVDNISSDRLRGELCRLMFEAFNDAMESDPCNPNIAFALMNFDLNHIESSTLDIPNELGEGLTCLHNLVFIAELFAVSDDPFDHQFSGLFDPVLRLFFRLCSIRAASSSILLRFLRSQYDLIFRLASSAVFSSIDLPIFVSPSANGDIFSSSVVRKCAEDETVFEIVHKTAQGVILELIALEMSALLRTGYIEQPQRFLKILLSIENSQNSTISLLPHSLAAEEPSKTLLWLLLDASRIFIEDLDIPNCIKFDTQRVLELLNFCIRKNSYGIEQYDVFYLHLMLNSEINCIMNTEIGLIKEEACAILNYCMKRNARNLLEGACVHLLEGWLSVLNVLSLHCPLPFIDTRTHQCLLVDALFLLRSYCNCVEMSPELAYSVAVCISRISLPNSPLVIAHSSPFGPSHCTPGLQQICRVQNGALCQLFARSGFAAEDAKSEFNNLCDFLLSKAKTEQFGGKIANNMHSMDGDPLFALVTENGDVSELWTQLFGQITHEIVRALCFDIMFAPLSLKLLAVATFIDVLREDIRHGGGMDTAKRIGQSPQTARSRRARTIDCGQKQTESLMKALKSLTMMAQSCVKSLALG